MTSKDKNKYLLAFVLMLIAAFIQCYKTIHDLHWANEPDFDRDIAYIRSTLDGHYGQDPNMTGQYMWYNPMLFLLETLVVKFTGLPINVVVARAGAFINILSPVAFFFMVIKLFDYKVALPAILCFFFLVNGNLPCWGGATYSPWLLSDTFSQFTFYITIFFVYKAFSSQKLFWFIIFGASLGITFLGHSAPVFIILLIVICIQGRKVVESFWAKDYSAVKTYFLQGLFAVIPFIIFAFPFLYYVYGKYHFHFVNHEILECAPGIFARRYTLQLMKSNVTFSLIISVIGMIWFYKKFDNPILSKIVWHWFFICLGMYIYESAVPTLDHMLHITLPDTIPAFHYFFYLKALQSIFFGFGFIFLLTWLVGRLKGLKPGNPKLILSDTLVIVCVLVYALAYYPIYINRYDFTELRVQAIEKGKQTDKIGVYDFISKNIPLDHVLLCEHGLSLFPAMPTGIKMVSIETYFSNPYLSYTQREDDRNAMLSYLTSTKPDTAQKLFAEYKVNDVLLADSDFVRYKQPAFATSKVIYKNSSYAILSFTQNNK